METNTFVKELKNIKLIAHRLGYKMTGLPENSLDSLDYIFNNESLLEICDGFEFDICFTKDLVPVVVHDKYIDDYTDKLGYIRDFTLEELKSFDFNYRKSNTSKKVHSFKIVTLEEILTFFKDRKKILGNRMIRIETKDYIVFDNKKMKILANILNAFSILNKNIVHISFWPINFKKLRKIQIKSKCPITKNDFLCDYSFLVFFSKFIPYIDGISLRVKNNNLTKSDIDNPKRVNKKIKKDLFWMKFSNTIKEKNIRYVIRRFGSVNLFVVNNTNDIKELCSRLKNNFFKNNSKYIHVTTDNPNYLRMLK